MTILTQEILTALRRNSKEDLDFFLRCTRNSFIERRSIRKQFVDVLLPEFLEDPERNKFRIALILAAIDSRRLASPMRVKLGLSADFRRGANEIRRPPKRPPIASLVKFQCSLAEDYLLENHELLEQDLIPSTYRTSIEFFQCLAGKYNGYFSGLCFETTEFSNGFVMLKDVWYLPLWKNKENVRLREKVVQLLTQSESLRNTNNNRRLLLAEDGRDDSLYQGNQDPVVTSTFIRWDNPGGVWTPTRALFQQNVTLSYNV